MEQKTNALKIASKVISVIAKIGYVAMIVVLSISGAMLIFMSITGGETSMFAIGGTNIIIFDENAATPAEISAICSVLLVMGGFLLAIFLLANKMFQEISLSGNPFTEKYVKFIRAIAILVAAMPIATGIVETIVTFFGKVEIPNMYADIPGIIVGVIIYCLSYIVDYGCALKKDSGTDVQG